jgi:hypothetical protein
VLGDLAATLAATTPFASAEERRDDQQFILPQFSFLPACE